MSVSETSLISLPQYEMESIARFLPGKEAVTLETVSKDFRDTFVQAIFSSKIKALLTDDDCMKALKRFHLIPRSSTECRRPILEKVKSVCRKIVPFFRHYPESIQRALDPSFVSPKEIFRSFYENLKILKTSVERDIPDCICSEESPSKLIDRPARLARYLDTMYLHGIEHILGIISPHSPAAQQIAQAIQTKKKESSSKAVQEAFRLAKELGPQVAQELSGRSFGIRSNGNYYSRFAISKTTWYADPTFYPDEFCKLLQSPTISLKDSGMFSQSLFSLGTDPRVFVRRHLNLPPHKEYCYCRFAPNTCKLERKLTWQAR